MLFVVLFFFSDSKIVKHWEKFGEIGCFDRAFKIVMKPVVV